MSATPHCITADDVRAAAGRIAGEVRRTPVVASDAISGLAGRPVVAKCESMQRTGSFKIRGATNAVRSLRDAEARRGVVTHSSGNHALALATAARARGIPAHVVMPVDASEVKRRAVIAAGATVHGCGPTSAERIAACDAVARETGATLVPPYDHPFVIAGQGTVGLEIAEQAPEAATVVVPVGGGGLIGGIAIALRALRPGIRIVSAMRFAFEQAALVIEPSAAVGIAALASGRCGGDAARPALVVLCGANVDLSRLPWMTRRA